jgi:hypothetical protein
MTVPETQPEEVKASGCGPLTETFSLSPFQPDRILNTSRLCGSGRLA